jgi:hypothetical protein
MSQIRPDLLRFLRAGALGAAAIVALAGADAAWAQTGETVNVHQYAVDHPVADVSIPFTPSLGASVPQSVQLATIGENPVYGYFYYEGRPIIVEMATRAVVRLD